MNWNQMFSKYVDIYMIKYDVTRKHIENKLGINQSQLSLWRTNKFPPEEKLIRIIELFEIKGKRKLSFLIAYMNLNKRFKFFINTINEFHMLFEDESGQQYKYSDLHSKKSQKQQVLEEVEQLEIFFFD